MHLPEAGDITVQALLHTPPYYSQMLLVVQLNLQPAEQELELLEMF